MTKSLEQLRQEKMKLLRMSDARRGLQNLARQKKVERLRLKAEIKALKNPNSIVAKKTAKRIAKRSGSILFKGAVALGKHLSAVAAEQNTPPKKRKSTKKAKTRRKRR